MTGDYPKGTLREHTISMNEGSKYEQQGNFGVGHLDDGEIKDNAKVASHLEEKNHNQSNKSDINLTVNIDSKAESNISKTLPQDNQKNQCSFEIKISGELIRRHKAEYAEYKSKKRRIEDIVDELRDLGINVELKYVEKGSVKIGLEGHPEDFQKLQELFQSGQLNEILGIPVEDISLVVDENSDEEETKNKAKARLIEEIRNFGAVRRNLSRADLSRADLSGADLREANLRGADLREANLRGANLRGVSLFEANLFGANLFGANLFGANLIEANLFEANLFEVNLRYGDLRGADLRGADLSEIEVNKTLCGDNKGITESLKLYLIRHGAIFKDVPGGRSGVAIPV